LTGIIKNIEIFYQFVQQKRMGHKSTMRKICILTSAMLLQIAVGAQLPRLDTLLHDHATREKVVGASLVLFDLAEEKTFIHNHGLRDKAAGQAVTDSTLFKIGSCTKAITAIAVMQLAERGLIDLNSPIEQYLPELRFRKPAAMPPISIRHLLTHTAGLRDDIENGSFAQERPPSCIHPDLLGDTLLFPPGHVWAYSNLGYGLLGCLIERVSGQPYGEYMQDHIFKPIGMAHTGLFDDLRHHQQMSLGYWGDQRVFDEAPVRDQAAGDLVSTPADMALFLEMLMRQGNINGQQILQPASLEMMMEDQLADVALSTGEEFGYGLFIFNLSTVADDTIGKLLAHKGDTRLFHTLFMIIPKQGLGIVVFTNTKSGNTLTNRLSINTAKFSLSHLRALDTIPKTSIGFEEAVMKYSPLPNAALTGSYDLGVGGFIKLNEKGKRRLKWTTDFKNPDVILVQQAPGLYDVKVLHFMVFHKRIKSLRIFFEEREGDIYMKQTSAGETESSYLAKRRKQHYQGASWEARSGQYEIVNLIEGTIGMVPTSLRTHQGLVYLKVKDSQSSMTQEITFEPLSEKEACHQFVGRGIGQMLRVLENGNLYYSGFEFRKR
jgi:CubicO group peptidase (beta-lactamase class C family)